MNIIYHCQYSVFYLLTSCLTVVYVIESAIKQKNTTLKDLRNIIRILENVKGGENKVVFSRMVDKKEICKIEAR